MSVKPNDCYLYGSASMPEDVGVAAGGAVSFSTKVTFNDVSAVDTFDYVSSNAGDTGVILTMSGRDASGTVKSESKTLTGLTPVAGAQDFERLLKCVASGTAAVGDVAALQHTPIINGHTAQAGSTNGAGTVPPLFKAQAGDGASIVPGAIIRIVSGTGAGQLRQVIDNTNYGTDTVAVNRDWSTLPDNTSVYNVHNGMLLDISPNAITSCRRPFYNVAADAAGGVARTFYEKIFAVNNNTVTTLNSAVVSKQNDPASGTLEFALCNSLNDTASVANRQTAPVSGVTAFSTGAAPQSINVPGGQLPSGAAPNAAGAQGIWLSLTLAAGLAPGKTSFTIQASGQTT